MFRQLYPDVRRTIWELATEFVRDLRMNLRSGVEDRSSLTP